MERRKFLQSVIATGLAGAAGHAQQSATPAVEPGSAADAAKLPRTQQAGEMRGEMLYRPLGRTGETVSALGLGGSHVAQPQVTESETIRLIHEALDRGINFMDNSWDYNEGASEMRMGTALAQEGYRKKAFLMTKIDGRTKETAEDQLNDSLRRLKTDHIDLIQFHEILRFDDPDRIFAEGGALESVLNAKKAGKVRFIGFTGHKDPHIHLYMLETAAKHGFSLRYRADAAKRDGCALPQFRPTGGSQISRAAGRRFGHEAVRRRKRNHPEEQHRAAAGMSALRIELADVRRDYGHQ